MLDAEEKTVCTQYTEEIVQEQFSHVKMWPCKAAKGQAVL